MYCVTRDLAHLQQRCIAGTSLLPEVIWVFPSAIAPAAL